MFFKIPVVNLSILQFFITCTEIPIKKGCTYCAMGARVKKTNKDQTTHWRYTKEK